MAAERAILAGIIKGGSDAFIEVDDILRVEFFFQESSQAIFKCIKKIFEKDSNAKIDLTSIISTAKELGIAEFFADKSQIQYLRSVAALDISTENVRKEAIKVTKLAVTRTLISKLEEAKSDLYKINGSESLASIIGIPENKINELSNAIDKDAAATEKIGKDANLWLENILANPRDVIGISTGFGLYDTAIGGGIRRKTVHLIVARAKCGKSSITDSTALHVAGQLNIPVLNIDTEMNKEDHLARIAANLTSIPITQIEKGKVSQNEAKKLRDAIKYIESIPYYYRCVANYSFEEIQAIIKRWVVKDVGVEGGRTKDCLVLYDYFKLMDSNNLKDMQEYQALGFQLSALNAFAIKYDFPCLSFAQTNRDGVTEETIDTIAGSDRLSWFASSVTMFKKKTAEEIAQDGIEYGNRKLIPLVARYGAGLDEGDYIHMNMKGEYCKIIELGTRNQSYMKKKEEEKGFKVDDAPI